MWFEKNQEYKFLFWNLTASLNTHPGRPRGRRQLPAEQGSDDRGGPGQQPRLLAPHEGRAPGQDQVLKAPPFLR